MQRETNQGAAMDVGGWLRRLGLEQYEAAFRENRIDDTVLPSLTAEDLKDLGVRFVGDRRKLLNAIAGLHAEASAPTPLSDARPLIEKGTRDTAERRHLTVMFCDLVGSTALSTRLDPEDMGEIIGAYHRCCAEEIAKAGGFVAKYMGDGVLAYFGYPEAHEDDAERGVRAALGLTGAVPKLCTGHEAMLQVRIGVATGLVVVGDLVGTGEAQERGVVGDTPNLAQRLQTLAEPGQVVISDSTRRLSAGLFEYRDLGKVALKGLADPVQAWWVTGTSTVASRFEAQHETSLTPLVGRDEELELLLRRWRRARSGEGQVVLLSGEPGIGKSRLTVAFEERLQDEPYARVRYFCSPHHTNSALYPTITELEHAADFERDDTPEAKFDKMTSLLDVSSGQESDAQLLSELLSIATGDSYAALNWSPQRKKEKTFDVLLRRLQMLSRRRPVLIVYEDVHWIDPSSRELLDIVVERVASLPVVLVITFRPEFQPPWTGQAHVSTLTLSRLGQREGAALVERVAGNKVLSNEITTEIVERTDGIPLFVEELTKAVMEEAAIGSVSAAPLDAGVIFRRGLLPDATFLFKHALVQDAAYGSLLKSRRQHLHGRIAQTLEERLPDQASLRPELVASHYAQAGMADQAIDYWDRAGRLAVERSAMAEAVVHFGKAIHLLAGRPESEQRRARELALQLALAGALMAVKGWASSEAGDAYARARALCREAPEGSQLAKALNGAWSFLHNRGEVRSAFQLADELIALSEHRSDRETKLMAYRCLGTSELFLAEFSRALHHLRQAITFYDRAEHRPPTLTPYDIRIACESFAAWTLQILGYADQALAQSRHALANARELAQPYTLAFALHVNCIFHQLRDDGPELQERSQELVALAAEQGYPHFVGTGTCFGAWATIALGGPIVEAIGELRRGLEAKRATGADIKLPYYFGLLAGAHGRIGQTSEGLTLLSDALEVIERTDERWFEAELYRLRGELLRAKGDREGAELWLSRSLAKAQAQNAKLWELRACRSIASLRGDQGKRTEGRKLLAAAFGSFTEGLDTPDLQEAKALLEELG